MGQVNIRFLCLCPFTLLVTSFLGSYGTSDLVAHTTRCALLFAYNSPMGMTRLRPPQADYAGQEEEIYDILMISFVYIFGDDRLRHRDF